MPYTDEIFVDVLSDLGKTGIYAFTLFQISKTNSSQVASLFTLFITKAFSSSNHMHLLPSWENTHSCFHFTATD